jgi:hypothetical protein
VNAHAERVAVVNHSALSEQGQEPKQFGIELETFGFLTGGRRSFERLLFERQIRLNASAPSAE